MKARVLYIPGWRIRWAEFDAPHISVEMHLEAEPTRRGGRPCTVHWTDQDGARHTQTYAEALYWERAAGPGEGGI